MVSSDREQIAVENSLPAALVGKPGAESESGLRTEEPAHPGGTHRWGVTEEHDAVPHINPALTSTHPSPIQ